MPNHAGALQGRFFPAKLETEGDDAIFNTLLSGEAACTHTCYGVMCCGTFVTMALSFGSFN